ncbi:MAG: BolA family transcriptional regulator [Rhodocyclaceae bacterium]|jgi:BolA protein|nr:BolA family transcriptional regulator [Rhodocyclaceae bacterium]
MNDVIARMRAGLEVLQPERIDIEDQSAQHAGHAGAASGGGHFRLQIVAAGFAGLPVMRRHRLVYDALGPLMKREIHALSIIAKAPEET